MATLLAPASAPRLGSGLDPEPIVARLASQPGVQKVPSAKLDLFIRRAFLPPESCTALIALIDAGRRPSTISDDQGYADYRTSETCDLAAHDPAVSDAEARIAALTGLSGEFGEPIQGQRYAVGQQFKDHTDYFEPNGVDYQRYCGIAGNRTWTVMI
jgi:prolyl 4-hydroxylase